LLQNSNRITGCYYTRGDIFIDYRASTYDSMVTYFDITKNHGIDSYEDMIANFYESIPIVIRVEYMSGTVMG
jgi:hypothetical protein